MTEPTDRDLDVALAVRDAIAAEIERVAAIFDDVQTDDMQARVGAARGIAARIRAFNVEGVIPCE